jgi:hypothetical protein
MGPFEVCSNSVHPSPCCVLTSALTSAQGSERDAWGVKILVYATISMSHVSVHSYRPFLPPIIHHQSRSCHQKHTPYRCHQRTVPAHHQAYTYHIVLTASVKSPFAMLALGWQVLHECSDVWSCTAAQAHPPQDSTTVQSCSPSTVASSDQVPAAGKKSSRLNRQPGWCWRTCALLFEQQTLRRIWPAFGAGGRGLRFPEGLLSKTLNRYTGIRWLDSLCAFTFRPAGRGVRTAAGKVYRTARRRLYAAGRIGDAAALLDDVGTVVAIMTIPLSKRYQGVSACPPLQAVGCLQLRPMDASSCV